MRIFKLVRDEDASGVSGTGEVAEGIEFKNGKCVMCWDTKTSSIAVYENVDELVAIHGHEGRTYVKFDDGVTVGKLDSWHNNPPWTYEPSDSWGQDGSSWG